ncbi:Coagulin domain containing protein [Sarcoptes scabiei]|uniref:Coagulin domain containing protein n=1 Tax=Sarcoptes scabiei TaxID=52283 RepID=A0A132ACU3_SARSC|nr:Coagulin domain containing protein [Sarcoptes scabiei]
MESRSIASWLGIGRIPQRRNHHHYHHPNPRSPQSHHRNRHQHPHSTKTFQLETMNFPFNELLQALNSKVSNRNIHQNPHGLSPNDKYHSYQSKVAIPISSTSSLPKYYSLDKLFSNDPNYPFAFMPAYTDAESLDYWLKFIEDPKIEEQLMPFFWDRKQSDQIQQIFNQTPQKPRLKSQNGHSIPPYLQSSSLFDRSPSKPFTTNQRFDSNPNESLMAKKNKQSKNTSRNGEEPIISQRINPPNSKLKKSKKPSNRRNHYFNQNDLIDLDINGDHDGDDDDVRNWSQSSSMMNDNENESNHLDSPLSNDFDHHLPFLNLDSNGDRMKLLKNYHYIPATIPSTTPTSLPVSTPNRYQHHLTSPKQVQLSQTMNNGFTIDSNTPRCDKFTEDICIDDFEYPEHAILDEIYKRKEIFQLMYAEVNGEVPLVDGIPKDIDESFSQDYYYSTKEDQIDQNQSSENGDHDDDYDGVFNDYHRFSNGNNLRKNLTFSKLNQSGEQSMSPFSSSTLMNQSKSSPSTSAKVEGYVCRSEVLYARPKLARNLKRKWRVIVNAGDYAQTIRMEKCSQANSECRFIAGHKYSSRCTQINSIHRLLVFEKGKGFYIDSFRIPTACTCHVMNAAKTSSSSSSLPSSSGVLQQLSQSSFDTKKIENIKTTKNLNNPELWASLFGSSLPASISSNGFDLSHLKQPLIIQQSNDPSVFSSTSEKFLNKLKSPTITTESHLDVPTLRTKSPQSNSQIEIVGNNDDLMKLLPQISSIDSDNLLQQIIDSLSSNEENSKRHRDRYIQTISSSTSTTSGEDLGLPDSFTRINYAQSNHPQQKHQQLQSDENEQLQLSQIAQTTPTSTLHLISHPSTSIDGMKSIAEQSPSTSIAPLLDHHHHDAPVVQVIHMPVSTTGLMSMDDLDDRMRKKLNTLAWTLKNNPNLDKLDYQQTQQQRAQTYSKYLTSASDNKYRSNFTIVKSNDRFNIDQNGYDVDKEEEDPHQIRRFSSNDNRRSSLEFSPNQTTPTTIASNSLTSTASIISPTIRSILTKIDSNENRSNRKKVNFSYHPILQYIVN